MFAKSSLNDPILITVNGIFQYKSDWIYLPFNDNSFKKEITDIDELNHANFFTKLIKNELYIISNGAGPVFKLDQNSFKRIDNSTFIKINLAELVLFTMIKFIYMVAMAFGHLKILLHFLMKILSNGIFFIIIVSIYHLEDGSQYIIY